MRRLPIVAFSTLAAAASAVMAAPADKLGERWVLTDDAYGTPIYSTLILKRDGDSLSGTLDGQALKGSAKGPNLHLSTEASGAVIEARTLDGRMEGSVAYTDDSDKAHPHLYRFTGEPAPAWVSGPPEHHEFIPTVSIAASPRPTRQS